MAIRAPDGANKKDLGWTASLQTCDRVLLFAGAEFIIMMTEVNICKASVCSRDVGRNI